MNSGNEQVALQSQAAALSIADFGKTLVVAPHQDDESLGCGGTIASLRQANIPVEVIFISDGSMSHPASKKYPAERLIAVREEEAVAALQILGVPETAVHFLRLKDSQVPDKNSPDFEQVVTQFQQLLNTLQPATVLVPWRRDPHQDHRATGQIVDAAITKVNWPLRRLEYLIWLWERGEAVEFPKEGEAKLWHMDIATVTDRKQKAIAAHLSQTTRLIDDDPDGFILSPEVLAHFNRNYELFVEIA